jgi:hypothetical protein
MTGDWREIHRTNDLRLARTIALSIASMEFDVLGASVHTGRSIHDELRDDDAGPFAIKVPAPNARDLQELINDIIDEQEAFDAECERRERAARRAAQVCILVALVLAGAAVAVDAARD